MAQGGPEAWGLLQNCHLTWSLGSQPQVWDAQGPGEVGVSSLYLALFSNQSSLKEPLSSGQDVALA